MRNVLPCLAACVLGTAPALAHPKLPIENMGLSVERTIRTGTKAPPAVSKVFLNLKNPNPGPVEARNIACQFHQDGKLVKRFTIRHLSVQPGESRYEAPHRVEGIFNKAVCNLGR